MSISPKILLYYIMYRTLLRKLCARGSLRRNLALSVCVGYTLYYNTPYHLSEFQRFMSLNEIVTVKDAERETIAVRICPQEEILPNTVKIVVVRDGFDKTHSLLLTRFDGIIYAVGGRCPHKEPLEEGELGDLSNATIYGDKLMCPNHGCTYCVRNGEIEHGPTLLNLPIFKVRVEEGVVVVELPRRMPTAIMPAANSRNEESKQLLVVLGGEDAGVVGFINGLRQTGYAGSIEVVTKNPRQYPMRMDYLHRMIPNLYTKYKYELEAKKLVRLTTVVDEINAINDKIKNTAEDKSELLQRKEKIFNEIKELDQIDAEINESVERIMEQKYYPKLLYYPQKYYQTLKVDFSFVDVSYRIIHKRFMPFIRYEDGSKSDFDGVLVSTGSAPVVPQIPNITVVDSKNKMPSGSENVFIVNYNKKRHLDFVLFMNKFAVNNILALGLKEQTLEFIDAVVQQFPQTKVAVIDVEEHSQIHRKYGSLVANALLQQYVSKGHKFYHKVQSTSLYFKNKFASSLTLMDEMGVFREPHKRYLDSVSVNVPVSEEKETRVAADCVVIFPNQYHGETKELTKTKYLTIPLNNMGLIPVTAFFKINLTQRVIATGSATSMAYYQARERQQFRDPYTLYEMGYMAAYNILAMPAPLYYIPVQYKKFGEKEVRCMGVLSHYDSITILGSVEKWDFISFYGINGSVVRMVASPSRQKEFQTYREAIRCNVMANVYEIENIPDVHQAVDRKLKRAGKSECIKPHLRATKENKDMTKLVFENRETPHDHEEAQMEDKPDLEFNENWQIEKL